MPPGESRKPGGINSPLTLELLGESLAFGEGLRFKVLYFGKWVRTAHFRSVGSFPSLMGLEPGPDGTPREGIDFNSLEPLAHDEIRKLQAAGGQTRVLTFAAGFRDLPASGPGKPGRPRDSEADLAVAAHRALQAAHLTDRHRRAIKNARKASLLRERELTESARDLVDQCDRASEELLRLLEEQKGRTADLETFGRRLVGSFTIDVINAAIADMIDSGTLRADQADDESRRANGFRYSRVEVT